MPTFANEQLITPADVLPGSRRVHYAYRELSAGGTALAASSTPYSTATVLAAKSGGAGASAVANDAVVEIGPAGGDKAAHDPLQPGQSVRLPDGGDLADYQGYNNDGDNNDGLMIRYTTLRA